MCVDCSYPECKVTMIFLDIILSCDGLPVMQNHVTFQLVAWVEDWGTSGSRCQHYWDGHLDLRESWNRRHQRQIPREQVFVRPSLVRCPLMFAHKASTCAAALPAHIARHANILATNERYSREPWRCATQTLDSTKNFFL